MGTVAESLIDQFTAEAIKEKMAEERNSGRASGSGEYGADLWVESMVSPLNSFRLLSLSYPIFYVELPPPIQRGMASSRRSLR